MNKILNISCIPHREYLKAYEEAPQKLFIMLKFFPKIGTIKNSNDISFVIVIDTSSSMRDSFQGVQKLDKAIEASHKLIDHPNLSNRDKISIINFDTESNVLLPLTYLDVKGKKIAHEKIEELRNYSGVTFMAKGLYNAYNILNKEETEKVKRIILLTDGQAFDEAECIEISYKLAQINVPIISLGIGEEYNQDLLIHLSDITRGEHYHLSDLNILDDIFRENIEKALKETFTNLKLRVQTVKGVELKRITRIYPSIAEISIEGKEINLGNIQEGDETVFVLEFDIKGLKRPPGRARLIKLNLWASSPNLGLKDMEFPPYEVYINFTTDVNLLSSVNQEVLDYVKQRNLNNIINQATKLVTENPQKATELLNQAKTIAQVTGNTLALTNIEKAITEFKTSGTISINTVKTLRFTTKTKTVKSQYTKTANIGISDNIIKDITGA